MTLAEKCAVAALYGDVSREARDRLLSFAEVPESGFLIGGAQSGNRAWPICSRRQRGARRHRGDLRREVAAPVKRENRWLSAACLGIVVLLIIFAHVVMRASASSFSFSRTSALRGR